MLIIDMSYLIILLEFNSIIAYNNDSWTFLYDHLIL